MVENYTRIWQYIKGNFRTVYAYWKSFIEIDSGIHFTFRGTLYETCRENWGSSSHSVRRANKNQLLDISDTQGHNQMMDHQELELGAMNIVKYCTDIRSASKKFHVSYTKLPNKWELLLICKHIRFKEALGKLAGSLGRVTSFPAFVHLLFSGVSCPL